MFGGPENSLRMQERNSNETQDARLSFIDISKGIGIILVICSHVYSPLMQWAYPCFIPIFFVVSGYCTTHLVSVKKKFNKLMLPYLLFNIILLVLYRDYKPVNFIGAIYSRFCLYPIDSKANIYFFNSGNSPLWFLTSMFLAFCFYKIIQLSKQPYHIAIIYIAITYILSYLPILLPWSADTALLMSVFILVGSFIGETKLLDRLCFPAFLLSAIIYGVLTLLCGGINLSVRVYGSSLFLLIPTAILGCVLLMKFSSIIDKTFIGIVLQKIGIHSLSIFSLHIPVLGFWQHLLSSVPFVMHSPYIIGVLIVSLTIVVMYPIAVIWDKLYKKLMLDLHISNRH